MSSSTKSPFPSIPTPIADQSQQNSPERPISIDSWSQAANQPPPILSVLSSPSKFSENSTAISSLVVLDVSAPAPLNQANFTSKDAIEYPQLLCLDVKSSIYLFTFMTMIVDISAVVFIKSGFNTMFILGCIFGILGNVILASGIYREGLKPLQMITMIYIVSQILNFVLCYIYVPLITDENIRSDSVITDLASFQKGLFISISIYIVVIFIFFGIIVIGTMRFMSYLQALLDTDKRS